MHGLSINKSCLSVQQNVIHTMLTISLHESSEIIVPGTVKLVHEKFLVMIVEGHSNVFRVSENVNNFTSFGKQVFREVLEVNMGVNDPRGRQTVEYLLCQDLNHGSLFVFRNTLSFPLNQHTYHFPQPMCSCSKTDMFVINLYMNEQIN